MNQSDLRTLYHDVIITHAENVQTLQRYNYM